jgi:hypothetical protein
MKSYKNKLRRNNKYTKNKSRKNKKGGFFNFFSSSSKVDPMLCDPMGITELKTPEMLHSKYQECCPKTMFGNKNSTPYCKQLDLNFQAALKQQNDAKEYTGFNPEEINQMKQNEVFNNSDPLTSSTTMANKKAWYKFWGGKRTHYNKKIRHNKTRRNKNLRR